MLLMSQRQRDTFISSDVSALHPYCHVSLICKDSAVVGGDLPPNPFLYFVLFLASEKCNVM